jgi:hypothetical protein
MVCTGFQGAKIEDPNTISVREEKGKMRWGFGKVIDGEDVELDFPQTKVGESVY